MKAWQKTGLTEIHEKDQEKNKQVGQKGSAAKKRPRTHSAIYMRSLGRAMKVAIQRQVSHLRARYETYRSRDPTVSSISGTGQQLFHKQSEVQLPYQDMQLALLSYTDEGFIELQKSS